MESVGGDKGMLAEVVLLCRDGDVPRLLADLGSSIFVGDTASAAKAAHGLKGMIGAFNAIDAWAQAKHLEASAKEGKTEGLREEADKFVQSLRTLLIALEEFSGVEHQNIAWI